MFIVLVHLRSACVMEGVLPCCGRGPQRGKTCLACSCVHRKSRRQPTSPELPPVIQLRSHCHLARTATGIPITQPLSPRQNCHRYSNYAATATSPELPPVIQLRSHCHLARTTTSNPITSPLPPLFQLSSHCYFTRTAADKPTTLPLPPQQNKTQDLFLSLKIRICNI